MKKLCLILLSLIFLTACAAPPPADNSVTTSSELNNDLLRFGFRRMKNQPPEFTKEQLRVFDKYSAYYIDKRTDKNRLYLTFDEGYENGYTSMILDTLKEHNTPAAFFITGPYLKKHGDLVKRMTEENHIVGNHTVNHPSMPSLTVEKLTAEIEGLSADFKGNFGAEMKFFRPPMGEYSERTLDLTNKLGLKTVFWSLAYKDWERDVSKGADYAYNEVMKSLHPGAVILLHAVSRDNAEGLSRIITDAEAEGYVFCSLSEYEILGNSENFEPLEAPAE